MHSRAPWTDWLAPFSHTAQHFVAKHRKHSQISLLGGEELTTKADLGCWYHKLRSQSGTARADLDSVGIRGIPQLSPHALIRSCSARSWTLLGLYGLIAVLCVSQRGGSRKSSWTINSLRLTPSSSGVSLPRRSLRAGRCSATRLRLICTHCTSVFLVVVDLLC